MNNQEIRAAITASYQEQESDKAKMIADFVSAYKAGDLEKAENIYNKATYGVQCQMEEMVE